MEDTYFISYERHLYKKQFLQLDLLHSPKTTKQPSKLPKCFLPIHKQARLVSHYGSMRAFQDFCVLSTFDILFFISQVQVNPSPTGPTSLASSKEDSRNSETTSPRNQEQSSRQRRADIISMSHMHALGVCTILATSHDNRMC